MGGLIAGALNRVREERATLADPPGWMFSAFGATATASGKVVSEDTAITFSAVYSAVKILAESISSLPLIYYRRVLPRGKERATDQRLFELLHDQPNEEQTSVEFWEFMAANVCLRGNAYSIKELDGRGNLAQIWPLRADQCWLERRGGNLRLIWRSQSMGEQVFDSSAVFRFGGLAYDGLTGLSPIAMARQGIGLALSAEEYGGRLFSNDSRPGGVLEHPGKLDPDTHKRLSTSWAEAHQGASNAHKAAILEEGMKWHQVGIAPEDAQFLQTRKFQITEVARIYRIPPHMLADLERATFTNIEQQSQDFVVNTLRPWLVRIEKSIRRDLIPKSDRSRYYAEFLVDALLRGDSASRATFYRELWSLGSLSSNDIRELENQNPVLGGDEYYVPLNFVPASQAGQPESGDDAARPVDESSQKSETLNENAVDSNLALNGAQISSLVEIVQNYNAGILSKDQAVGVIVAGYPFNASQASTLLGDKLEPPSGESAAVDERSIVHSLRQMGFRILDPRPAEEVYQPEIRDLQTRSVAARRRIGQAFRALFEDAAERLRKLEDVEIRKLAKRHLITRDVTTWDVALDELYGEDGTLREKFARIMGPVFAAYARQIWGAAREEIAGEPGTEPLDGFTPLLVAGFVSRHAISSVGQMKTASREAEGLAGVEGRLEHWAETRAARIATREIGQSNGAVTLHAFRTSGVTKKQWVAFGDTCPFCTGLDGKIVGVESNFATSGDTLGPTDDPGRTPLRVSKSIGHPPIHPGCDCTIVAV